MKTFDDIIDEMSEVVESVLNEAGSKVGADFFSYDVMNGWQRLDTQDCEVDIAGKILTSTDNLQVDANGEEIVDIRASAVQDFSASIAKTLVQYFSKKGMRIEFGTKAPTRLVSLKCPIKGRGWVKITKNADIEKYKSYKWMLILDIEIPPANIEQMNNLARIWSRNGTFSGTEVGSEAESTYKYINYKADSIFKLFDWDPREPQNSENFTFDRIGEMVLRVVISVARGMCQELDDNNQEATESFAILEPILRRLVTSGRLVRIKPFAEAGVQNFAVLKSKSGESTDEYNAMIARLRQKAHEEGIEKFKLAISGRDISHDINKPSLQVYIEIPKDMEPAE